MRVAWLGGALVGSLLSLAAVSESGLEVRHEPATCVVVDRYARVSARGVPADEVASADLRFRVDEGSPWYSLRMVGENGSWSAFLPRPQPSLRGFEYQIVMTSKDRSTSSTGIVPVRVSPDPAACAVDAPAAVTSAIVVTVPPGAPVVPPVPPGFSPVGVVTEQKLETPRSSHKMLLILAGAAIAGGVAAAVVPKSESSAPEPDVPEFFFNATLPSPGSVLHPTTMLVVLVRMSREPSVPLTFDWRFELLSNAGSPVCAFMADTFVRAQSPPGLALTAPLQVTGLCGTRFSVRACRLIITVQGATVLDQTLDPLPFEFEL